MTYTFTTTVLMVSLAAGWAPAQKENRIEDNSVLPWRLIAEKVQRGVLFCRAATAPTTVKPSRLGSNESAQKNLIYSHPLNTELTIETAGMAAVVASSTKVGVRVCRWTEGEPPYTDNVSGPSKWDGAEFKFVFKEPGLYRLWFYPEAEPARQLGEQLYFIVCDDWKADILAFCRRLKEKVELERGLTLERASIVVSHFDRSMEIASGATALSGQVLKSLCAAIESQACFENGGYPDLVVGGLTKIALKRFAGAAVSEFVVFVPEDYEPSVKWPVLLYPDPRRREARNNYAQRSGMVDVWWHLPGYQTFDWKDYEHFLGLLISKLNIDKDRIYVYGICANGIAAMALALNYPDQWAGCVSILGNSYRDLACNAYNLPLIYVPGGHSQDYRISSYKFALSCLSYWDCVELNYSSEEGEQELIEHLRGRALEQQVRRESPRRVIYRVKSLGNPKAYWVKVLGRENENFSGTIDACVGGNTVLVRTQNIGGYSLDLAQAPVDFSAGVEIFENGHRVGLTSNRVFTRRPAAWAEAAYVKDEKLHGPVGDAFTDPYVVVWGSRGEDTELIRSCRKTALSLAGGGLCFADVNVPEKLVTTHNLVLVGSVKSNLFLQKIAKTLPVTVREGSIIADGDSYGLHETGYIVIYPNPVNPARYVLVFSAASCEVMDQMYGAYLQMQSMEAADTAVFGIKADGGIKWYIIEKFDTAWCWHARRNQVLCTAARKHAKWRWAQWAGRAVRKELGADVMILDMPFRFSDLPPVGVITQRDLFQVFRNDWVVKVALDGRSLRSVVTRLITGAQNKRSSGCVLDGLRFAADDSIVGKDFLELSKIDDDAEYTMCFPEQMATELTEGTDYEIRGEGYMVVLLESHLCRNKEADIDSELDAFKLNVF